MPIEKLKEWKARRFTWAWGAYAPQPDPTMTPERALRLLCAWRRSERQPRNGGPLRRVKRLGRGIYRVTDLRFGETATIAWEQVR